MGKVIVLNKHHFKCDDPTLKEAIYIGRGSPLGNPYPVQQYGRDNCIEMYKVWLDDQIKQANQAVIKELDHIANQVLDKGESKLLCFCKPKNCHGDHIAKVVLDKIDTYKEEQLIYAGIGSRETPIEIQQIMCSIAEQLAPRWVLRSGYAEGADQAFFAGANEAKGEVENFIPWAGFNNAPASDRRFRIPERSEKLETLSRKYHPAWNRLSEGAKLLHERNACQVLGYDLETPVKMVICWTPDGKGQGGTGQALRIARDHHIPIFDLALPNTPANLMKFVENMEAE